MVEKLSNISISENTIVSSFDIVSMHTNIDVTISGEVLKNKIEENYHLIEVSAMGIDCEVLMTLVKICNKFSMYFQFRDSFYQEKKWVTRRGTFVRATGKYLCRNP